MVPRWTRRSARSADSEEKQEPASDIDTAVVDSLKALDPKWPIREADNPTAAAFVRYWSNSGQSQILARRGLSAYDPKRDIAAAISCAIGSPGPTSTQLCLKDYRALHDNR